MPDLSREIGRLAGVIEGMQETLERVDKRQEGFNILFSQHIRDDDKLRGDVDAIQQWRDGEGDEKGAEAQLNDIRTQRTWLLGIGTCVTTIISIVGFFGGAKVGAWLQKVFE